MELLLGAENLCGEPRAGLEGGFHAMWKQFEEDPEVEVVVLMHAANTFNWLNREQFLAEVKKSWPGAARFIFNAYKGYKMIFVDGTDGILYSEDGCTQGDLIAMLLYSVGVKPLFEVLFADDSSTAGKLETVWPGWRPW